MRSPDPDEIYQFDEILCGASAKWVQLLNYGLGRDLDFGGKNQIVALPLA